MAEIITAELVQDAAGKRCWLLSCQQTLGGVATEWNTANKIPKSSMFRAFWISWKVAKTGSGTSTTVQPACGKVAGGGAGTPDQVNVQATPAPFVEEPVPIFGSFTPGQDGILYFNAGFTGGNDNAANWVVCIEEF